MKKKMSYTEAELEIVRLEGQDIITTSGNLPGGSTGNNWGSGGDLDHGAWD